MSRSTLGTRVNYEGLGVFTDEVVWSRFELYEVRRTETGLMHGTVEVSELMALSGIELRFDLEQYRTLLATMCGSVD